MTTTHLLLPALLLPPLPSVSTQQAECWKQKADHINPLRKALRTFPLFWVVLRCPSRGCPVRLSVISLTSSPAPPLTHSAPLASLHQEFPSLNLPFPLPGIYYFLYPDIYMDRSLTWFRSWLKSLSRRSLSSSLLLLTFATLLYFSPQNTVYDTIFSFLKNILFGNKLRSQKSSKNKDGTKITIYPLPKCTIWFVHALSLMNFSEPFEN